MALKLLVLNLGGTSTKVSIFEDDRAVVTESISHSVEDMEAHPLSKDQVAYRKALVVKFIGDHGCTMDDFDAVVMRAPPFPAPRCGTYLVSGKCRDVVLSYYHPDEKPIHGNRILLPLIDALLDGRDTPIYLVDPPMVDEFPEIAHVSGIPGYPRKPTIHQLNQKAVARKYAKDIGREYADLRLIIAHLGGGISIGAHEYGVPVDSNQGSEGWGPFSTDRAGTVATDVMLELCFDKGLTRKEVYRMIRGNAGLKGHLGTDDLREIEKRIENGDRKAELVYNAMAFQIAKEIGSCYAVLKGKVDAILFTGGIAHSKKMIDAIKEYVGGFAPIAVYPGELEQQGLASGAYRVLKGLEEPYIM